MLLEGLTLGLLNAVSTIKRTSENEKSKRDTASLTPEGNVMSIGRTGQVYVNNEETYRWSETDKYGNVHNLIIGTKSGRVYSDSYDRMLQRENEIAEKNKQDAIKIGRLTYIRFCPQLGIRAETEIKTGKVITCFGEFYNERTEKTTYRKWYLQPSQKGKYERDRTVKGDFGVEITKEEYDKLNSFRLLLKSGMPQDEDVMLKLTGFDSLEDRRRFYEEKGKKQREEWLRRMQW